MKKNFITSIGIAVVLTIFTSCYSLPTPTIYDYKGTDSTTYLGTDVNVDFSVLEVSDFGYEGFGVNVENNTDKPIFVNFEKSSISYSDSVNIPFITGCKFADAGYAPSLRALPAGLTYNFEMYSSEQPSYKISTGTGYYPTGSYSYSKGEWDLIPISIPDNTPITILLCVEIDEEPYYWTSSFTYVVPEEQ